MTSRWRITHDRHVPRGRNPLNFSNKVFSFLPFQFWIFEIATKLGTFHYLEEITRAQQHKLETWQQDAQLCTWQQDGQVMDGFCVYSLTFLSVYSLLLCVFILMRHLKIQSLKLIIYSIKFSTWFILKKIKKYLASVFSRNTYLTSILILEKSLSNLLVRLLMKKSKEYHLPAWNLFVKTN